MRLIDADKLCEDLFDRWSIADTRKEELIRRVMADIVTPIIASQPNIEPQPQWIPCSERSPENGEQVLVYAKSVHYALAKYDEMREADGTYKKQWVTFDAWSPFYTIKEVIAWMPLPSPYQPKEDES